MRSISKTARAFCWLLGTIFIVGFVLGLVTSVQENKATLAIQTLGDLDLIYGKEGIELRHRCGKQYTHAYDVGTGELRRNAEIRQPAASILLLTLRNQRAFLTSAVGGASGGWTLWKMKDAAMKSKKAPRRILVRAGLVLTGYAIGYSIAGEIDASCTSNATNDFLQDDDSWLILERAFASQQLKQFGFGNKEWLVGDQTFTDQYLKQARARDDLELSIDYSKYKSIETHLDDYDGRVIEANSTNCAFVVADVYKLVNALEEVNYNPSADDFVVIASITRALYGADAAGSLQLEPCLTYSRLTKLPKPIHVPATQRQRVREAAYPNEP